MKKNTQIITGISLASVAAIITLLICKKIKYPCCKETMAGKCDDGENKHPKRNHAKH